MADKKTSQEVDGTTFQKTDLTRIARGGSNYKLTAEQVFSEEITKTNFQILQGDNKLIPQRTYKVTDCGVNDEYTYYVTASTTNFFYFEVVWQSAESGNVIAGITSLSDPIEYLIDNKGNKISFPEQYWYGYNQYDFHNNLFNNTNDIDWSDYAVARDCIFKNNFLFFQNWEAYNCEFDSTTINQSTFGGDYFFAANNSKFLSVNIEGWYEDAQFTFNNCTFENVIFDLTGDMNNSNRAITLSNCNFKNCTVKLRDALYENLDIRNCTLIGVVGETSTVYTFSGTEQTRVIDYWAGEAHAANGYGNNSSNGYSTIKANVLMVDEEGTFVSNIFPQYVYSNEEMYVYQNSPIGIYLLKTSDFVIGTKPQLASIYNHLGNTDYTFNHSIVIQQARNGYAFDFDVAFLKKSTYSVGSDILQPHGTSVEVGKLYDTISYITIAKKFEAVQGLNVWCLIDGQHYD